MQTVGTCLQRCLLTPRRYGISLMSIDYVLQAVFPDGRFCIYLFPDSILIIDPCFAAQPYESYIRTRPWRRYQVCEHCTLTMQVKHRIKCMGCVCCCSNRFIVPAIKLGLSLSARPGFQCAYLNLLSPEVCWFQFSHHSGQVSLAPDVRCRVCLKHPIPV